jgi:methyl-accepting chemotaxis protein
MPIHGAAFMMLQNAPNNPPNSDNHLAMIFVGIIAAALVVQAIGVVIAASFAAKLLYRVDGIANEIHDRTLPLIDKTNAIVQDLAPKIQGFTENAEQISYTVRAKVDELAVTVSELNATVQGINGRARMQVTRVDGIVTNALVATEEIAESVQQSIKVPVRQIAGVIAGLKAGLETLIERSPFGRG